jgi:hypothetical protein
MLSGCELIDTENISLPSQNILPSFDSFGQAVSEEKIFLEINQSVW